MRTKVLFTKFISPELLEKEFGTDVEVVCKPTLQIELTSKNEISAQIDAELFILNIWAITQNYADFATQVEMVTGKTLRNRSMQQRIIQHTVHLMLYGAMPRN